MNEKVKEKKIYLQLNIKRRKKRKEEEDPVKHKKKQERTRKVE